MRELRQDWEQDDVLQVRRSYGYFLFSSADRTVQVQVCGAFQILSSSAPIAQNPAQYYCSADCNKKRESAKARRSDAGV
jgi:hypothetical protein